MPLMHYLLCFISKTWQNACAVRVLGFAILNFEVPCVIALRNYGALSTHNSTRYYYIVVGQLHEPRVLVNNESLAQFQGIACADFN
jgi:hypothetical protein